jgi:hypothetical protein
MRPQHRLRKEVQMEIKNTWLKIVGEGQERVEPVMGRDPMHKDYPGDASKRVQYSAFNKVGQWVGCFATANGAVNIGWGRTPDESARIVDEAMCRKIDNEQVG